MYRPRCAETEREVESCFLWYLSYQNILGKLLTYQNWYQNPVAFIQMWCGKVIRLSNLLHGFATLLFISSPQIRKLNLHISSSLQFSQCMWCFLSLISELITEKAPGEQFISRAESVIIPILFKGISLDEETKKDIVNKFHQFYFEGKSTYEDIIIASIDVSMSK